MAESGYILAGFEALGRIINNFMNGKRGRWNDNFTRDQISGFFSTEIAGLLHSYGQNFSGKKLYHKYNAAEAKVYQRAKQYNVFGDCPMIADSGGFQISNGRLTRKEADLLLTMYYEWLQEYPELVDKAFILDVPPGPGCRVFNNFYDVYKLNLESYERAKEMPEEIRKKMIYIHHFRTPNLWDIYTKIMRDNDMFSSFEYHGTGGIVANMASDMGVPCIMYVLPIIPLINEAKKCGRNYLNFHILGGANYRDIFFYEFITHCVWKVHNFTINLTYDSSAIFKQVMQARYMYTMDGEGFMRKMDIRTDNLKNRFYDLPLECSSATVEETMQTIFNDMSEKYDWGKVSVDGVYDDDRGTFHEDIKIYSMLRILANYSRYEKFLKGLVHKLYPLYEAGDVTGFFTDCTQITKCLNQGKVTKKQDVKTQSILRSLDMLKNLDEDYCEYVVKKYLQFDEFADLDDKKEMTI